MKASEITWEDYRDASGSMRDILAARLDAQAERIATLTPLAQAAVRLEDWRATVNNATADPETPRDVMDEYLMRYQNALDLLTQAVEELPDAVRDEWLACSQK